MENENINKSWETAIRLFYRPQLVLQGTVEYAMAWSFTRRWWLILLLYSPMLLLVLGMAGLVTYGWASKPKALVERYNEWVAEELPAALQEVDGPADDAASDTADEQPPAGSPPSGTVAAGATEDGAEVSRETAEGGPSGGKSQNLADVKEVSRLGELLLRRLLQLEEANSRATYLVAVQLARQGRVGQAQQMMRRIAPEDGNGFLPAHAWLAIDQISRQKVHTYEDQKRLAGDLTMAARWSRTPPALLSVYADLLESQGNVDAAMKLLQSASERNESLPIKVKLANLAARHGRQQQLARTAEEVKTEIGSREKEDTATPDDLLHLARLHLLEGKPELARAAAERGLSKDPQSKPLRRMLSESYRIEYRLRTSQHEGQLQVNLGLLDAALKIDPSNPEVGVEVAKLITFGREAPPELKAALEQQLKEGQATALTHILLANRNLLDGNLAAAVPHLEIALRQAPENPMVMNNLALALARSQPEALQRALQLSSDAVQLSPTIASYRDTLGDIRAVAGDKLGAIQSYETAIGLDGELLDTRQKLAELYRDLGMAEMASIQEQELQKRRAANATAPQ